MDRSGPRARALIAAALALAGAGPAVPTLPIREARWAAPDSRFETLAREPRECLVEPRDPATRRSAAIGRIAFQAPLLLGGQAARAGMSCASCHRNGRGNPAFLFPGLSGGPGTADVTSSLMSSHRGDRTVNPKPIPDLAGPRERLKVDRDKASGALERFIRGLIVEEFDGPEPPAEVLRGLGDYVRALRPPGCRRGDRRIALTDRLDEVRRAVELARNADPATAFVLIGAARSTLGAIEERFQAKHLDRDRAILLAASADLRSVREGRSGAAAWLRRWPGRRTRLLADEDRSLFSAERLRDAMAD